VTINSFSKRGREQGRTGSAAGSLKRGSNDTSLRPLTNWRVNQLNVQHEREGPERTRGKWGEQGLQQVKRRDGHRATGGERR